MAFRPFPQKDWNQLPEWAVCGRARQIRWDGGPIFAACQIESQWGYIFDPTNAGYVGVAKALRVLPSLYSEAPEERLRLLEEAGYNWVWITWFLGYAPEDQEQQYRVARETIHRLHARRMAVTAYFSLTSLFRSSLFTAIPEAETWQQRHADGQPILYAGIAARPMGCVNNPGWMDYLKRHVTLAVEAGADDIFWDSIFNRCYCDFCRAAFRAFSHERYGREMEAPGDTRRITAGEAIAETYLDIAPSAEDLAHALFTEFTHYTVAQAIQALDAHAKSIRASVLTSANTHRMRYVDEVCDIVWSEDAQHLMPRIEDGKRISAVPVHKWCWAASRGKKPIAQGTQLGWQVQEPDDYRLAVAEAAAFQGAYAPLGSYHFGIRLFTGDPKPAAALEAIGQYQRFLAAKEPLYTRIESVANVAVYHSHASRDQLRASGKVLSSSPLLEEGWCAAVLALFDADIPHDLLEDVVFVATDTDALAKRYRVLILSGVTCLNDDERSRLAAYVAQGGTLLTVGPVGTHTEFWEPHRQDVPAWLMAHASSAGIESEIERQILSLPSDDNAALVAAVRQRLGDDLSLRVNGPPFLAANLVTASQGKIGVIHLVNYATERPATAVRVQVNLRALPVLLRQKSRIAATLQSPEHADRAIPYEIEDGQLIFSLPEVRIYEVIDLQ